jgi:phosphoribosyl 1,2-cyclic phosphodiesterase
MSLSFCVLGSGSSGNSTLLASGAADPRCHALIDAGLSPRMTAQRLQPLGVRIEDLRGLLLTHLDGDHFHHGWPRAIARLGLRVHVHEAHEPAARAAGLRRCDLATFTAALNLPGDVHVRVVRLAHDEQGTCGFVIDAGGRRLGYATDLGHAPESLFRAFEGLHALAIESNYDPSMQLASSRPWFLKQRIMGGAGHLSNEESLLVVQRIEQRSTLRRIVALHLSRQCNDPAIVRELYARQAPHLAPRLVLSSQGRATPMMAVGTASGETADLFQRVAAEAF